MGFDFNLPDLNIDLPSNLPDVHIDLPDIHIDVPDLLTNTKPSHFDEFQNTMDTLQNNVLLYAGYESMKNIQNLDNSGHMVNPKYVPPEIACLVNPSLEQQSYDQSLDAKFLAAKAVDSIHKRTNDPKEKNLHRIVKSMLDNDEFMKINGKVQTKSNKDLYKDTPSSSISTYKQERRGFYSHIKGFFKSIGNFFKWLLGIK